MTTQEWQASARLQDLSESCPTTDLVLADKRDILVVCSALKRSEDLREAANDELDQLRARLERAEAALRQIDSPAMTDEMIAIRNDGAVGMAGIYERLARNYLKESQ